MKGIKLAYSDCQHFMSPFLSSFLSLFCHHCISIIQNIEIQNDFLPCYLVHMVLVMLPDNFCLWVMNYESWILGNIFSSDSINHKPFQQQKFSTKWLQSEQYWNIDHFNAHRGQPIKTRTLYYITATYLPVSLPSTRSSIPSSKQSSKRYSTRSSKWSST